MYNPTTCADFSSNSGSLLVNHISTLWGFKSASRRILLTVSPFEKPALRFYNFDWVVAMRRNAIDFETLLRITEGFCKEKGLDNSRGKRGRPPFYPMSVILAIWLLKTMLRLSYRQTEAVLRSFLFQNVPLFSTLHYRVSTIEEELWQEFLKMAGK